MLSFIIVICVFIDLKNRITRKFLEHKIYHSSVDSFNGFILHVI